MGLLLTLMRYLRCVELIKESQATRSGNGEMPPTLLARIKVRAPPLRRSPSIHPHHHVVIEDPLARLERPRMEQSGLGVPARARALEDGLDSHEVNRLNGRKKLVAIQREEERQGAGTFKEQLVDFLM